MNIFVLISVVLAWCIAGCLVMICKGGKFQSYYGYPTPKKVFKILVLWPYALWEMRQ